MSTPICTIKELSEKRSEKKSKGNRIIYFSEEEESPKEKILSASDIINSTINRQIIIYPFNPIQVNKKSYDITLSECYYRNNKEIENINPFYKENISNYWEPEEAEKIGAFFPNYKDYGFSSEEEKFISLDEGELILCHSKEFFNLAKNIDYSIQLHPDVIKAGLSVNFSSDLSSKQLIFTIANLLDSEIIIPVGQVMFSISFTVNGKEKTRSSKEEVDLKEYANNWNFNFKNYNKDSFEIINLRVNDKLELLDSLEDPQLTLEASK